MVCAIEIEIKSKINGDGRMEIEMESLIERYEEGLNPCG